MKLKRFLSLFVAVIMVMAMVPAMSLTASAADLEWVSTTKLAAYGYNFTNNAKRTDLGGYEGAYVSWGNVRTGVAAFELPAGVTFNPETQALIGLLTMTAKDNNGGTNTAGIYPINPTAVVNESGVADARSNKGSIIGTIRSTGGNSDHDVSSIVNLSSAVVDGKIGLLISNMEGYGSNISTYKNLALSVAVVDKAVIYENGSGDVNKSMDSEWIEIEFTMSGPDGGYRDWQVTDLGDNKFTGFCYAGATDGFYPQDRQSLSSGYSYVDGFDTSTKWTSGSSKMRITVISKDNKYQVTYTIVDGETETVVAALNYKGTPNGIKLPANWVTTQGDTDFGFDDVKISAVKVAETIVDVVATYTVDDAVVHTETGRYDTAEGETGVTFPAYSYSANGTNAFYTTEGATLSENGTIALDVVANAGTHAVGDVFAKDGVQYEIKSANLIPNGDFAYGTTGWYGADFSNAGFFTANGDGTMTITAGGTGAGGANSLYRAWAIEKEKKYLFTFDTDAENIYDKVSVKDDISATADGTVIINGASAGTNSTVFTAANDYVQVNFRWLGANQIFGNFGLYEVEEAEVAVQETVAAVAEIASVKVIGDTAVVLPTTVAVTGSLGSHVNAPIEWNAPETYAVGTTEVTGTATVQFGEQEATTANVSTTVTVLEETFTLSDITTVNGQDVADESLVKFPVAISNEFSIEFTANYDSFGDLWITLKDSARAKFFGPEQVPLGSNASGAFRPVNGNGTGGRTTSDSDKAQLVTGVNYRFFVTTDASTDKYTVSIFDEATGAEVVTVENFGYRTNADYIDSIVSLTNNGKGSVTLTNIKVNAPGVSKNEYMVSVTMDGETVTSVVEGWSAEDVAAGYADIEGYEKTVTIDGNTITVVYTSTKDVTITFLDANENVVLVVSETVKSDETVTVPAQEVYDAVTCKFYTIPETVAETSTVVVVSENAEKIAVVADAFHNASDAQPWNNDENMLFVGSAGVTNLDDYDANGENVTNKTDGGNLGSARVALVKFPVPTVSENQAVKLNVYVAKANQNLGNGNWMKIAANVSSVEANEVENAYVAGDLANIDGLVWSDNAVSAKSEPVDGRMEVNEWAEIDVTNFVKAAEGETITFALYAPTAGFYVADREKAVAGGEYQGKAAYLSVEDAFVVTETGFATLTKNGSAMTTAYAVAGDDIRLVADGAVVIGTDAGYVEANKNLNLTEATAFENTIPAGLGLAMVDGAQVRVGTTELEAGAKLDAMADSGIRFLATADYADTVIADDAVEFGIKVTAEASDAVAYVEATKFQDENNTVFSAAITNLKESNYNRKYTAAAYAKVPMADGTVKEFTTNAVTRSIYQVSAGLMKGNGEAENGDAYTVDGVVKNVLNAYVNQTGIRLGYNGTGMAVEEGKYTGDVFFTVSSEAIEGGVKVTIAPDTTWGTPAEIATWWMDYVRVNNNNSVAKTYIANAEIVEGVLTFDFMYVAE